MNTTDTTELQDNIWVKNSLDYAENNDITFLGLTYLCRLLLF